MCDALTPPAGERARLYGRYTEANAELSGMKRHDKLEMGSLIEPPRPPRLANAALQEGGLEPLDWWGQLTTGPLRVEALQCRTLIGRSVMLCCFRLTWAYHNRVYRYIWKILTQQQFVPKKKEYQRMNTFSSCTFKLYLLSCKTHRHVDRSEGLIDPLDIASHDYDMKSLKIILM